MKQLTLVYLLRENEICLALKKRGFGEGYYNGFGGKVEDGETLTQATVREVYEESTVIVQEKDLQQVADIISIFKDAQMHVHVYFARTWTGEPEETEEMKPKWFLHSNIPYAQMWSSDYRWIPSVLIGKKLRGTIYFKEDGKNVDTMDWEEVTNFT